MGMTGAQQPTLSKATIIKCIFGGASSSSSTTAAAQGADRSSSSTTQYQHCALHFRTNHFIFQVLIFNFIFRELRKIVPDPVF